MKPKAFVLYPQQWGPLSCLADEQLGRLFRHIFLWLNNEMSESDAEANVESDILLAFRFMRMQINIDIDKYQQLCERNRQKALKRWSNNANDAAASSAMHKKEKENEKENENKNENKNACSIAAADNDNNNGEAVKEAAAAKIDNELFEKIKAYYLPNINKILRDNESKIPPIRIMTPIRAQRIHDICTKYSHDALMQSFRRASLSPFLNGRGKKNQFIATVDWILDEKNFLKVYEGNYNV